MPLHNGNARPLVPRLITLAVLPLLAAAALTVAGSASADSFLRTDPYGLITGIDRNPWCEEEDEASVIDGPADLRGAHFSFSLACLSAATAIPRELAADVPDLEHVPPSRSGTEFLLVQVALQADYTPEYETATAFLNSWIQAGPERIALRSVPASWVYFVLSVPVGEPAVLWVEDDGRAQGLDLRTGEPVDPLAPYYQAIGFWTLPGEEFRYEEVRFGTQRRWWNMSCTADGADVTRSLWRQDRGWAPEGTVFLSVDFWWCGEGTYDETTWTLDTEKALEVGSGSEYLRPIGWTQSPNGGTGGGAFHTAVFEVPADRSEFKIVFAPYGEVTELANDEVHRLIEPPEATIWTVEF